MTRRFDFDDEMDRRPWRDDERRERSDLDRAREREWRPARYARDSDRRDELYARDYERRDEQYGRDEGYGRSDRGDYAQDYRRMYGRDEDRGFERGYDRGGYGAPQRERWLDEGRFGGDYRTSDRISEREYTDRLGRYGEYGYGRRDRGPRGSELGGDEWSYGRGQPMRGDDSRRGMGLRGYDGEVGHREDLGYIPSDRSYVPGEPMAGVEVMGSRDPRLTEGNPHQAVYSHPYGRGFADDARAGADLSDRMSSAFDRMRLGLRRLSKAPKSYTRSDERIREEIYDRLANPNSGLNAEHVEVKVDGGAVILSGNVEDRYHKRAIEDLCEMVLGVKDIQNNLKVVAPQPQAGFGQPGAVQGATGTTQSTTDKTPQPNGTRGNIRA